MYYAKNKFIARKNQYATDVGLALDCMGRSRRFKRSAYETFSALIIWPLWHTCTTHRKTIIV